MDFRTLWKNHFETLHLFKRLARCDVVRRKVSATDSSSRKLASTTQSVRMKLIKKIESKRNQRRRTLVHLLKESVDAMGAVEVVMELGWTDGQSGLLSCLSASLGIRGKRNAFCPCRRIHHNRFYHTCMHCCMLPTFPLSQITGCAHGESQETKRS